MAEENVSYSAKRPVWQWVLIYVVIGLVVYGLVYYFVSTKKGGGTSYSPVPSTPPAVTSESSPSAEDIKQEVILLTAKGFSPASLTISTGTKVIWVNQSGAVAIVDSNPHPAHTDYQPLNLGNFPDKGRLFLTFDKPGTYKYHNHFNPSQSGTITVQ